MGCKKELDCNTLPFKIQVDGIQSITVCAKLEEGVNLYKLALKLDRDGMFEPELFPGLRFIKYNPLCVNIFSSGKVVILGIKTLEYQEIVKNILENISSVISDQLL